MTRSEGIPAHPRLIVREVGDETIVYDVETDRVHFVAAPAADALAELESAGLVPADPAVSRRALLARGAALGGAAVVGAPLITSIFAPTAAAAASTIGIPQVDVQNQVVGPVPVAYTYDVYKAFAGSLGSNPSPDHFAWQEKSGMAGNVSAPLTHYFGGGAIKYWSNSASGESPLYDPKRPWVGINPTAASGRVLMFPGKGLKVGYFNQAESAMVTFTVPTAGAVDGVLTFTYENPSNAAPDPALAAGLSTTPTGPTSGDGAQVAVYHQDGATWVLPPTNLSAAKPTVSVHLSGAVSAGSGFQFVVGPTISYNNQNDLVSLSGSITVTVDPSAG